MQNSKICVILLLAVIQIDAADDKWSWSRNNPNRDSDLIDRADYQGGSARVRVPTNSRPYQIDEDRVEQTTPRPLGSSNSQKDEFYNELGNQQGQRFNGFGLANGQFPPNYNGLIGGGSGVGGPNRFPPGGFGPGGGGVNGPPGFGGYGGSGGFFGPNRGNPANGVLVGPGGPTGIIGRPPPYNNRPGGYGGGYGYGGGFPGGGGGGGAFGPGGAPPPPGYFPPGAGLGNGPFGGFGGRPGGGIGGFGGAPFNRPPFDDFRSGAPSEQTRKVEKKSAN